MIVALTNHLKNAVNGSRLLSSSAIATPVFKRFGSSLEYNEVLKMAKETEDKEYEQLKKYRQAEVHLWHSMAGKSVNPKELTEEQWQHLYELETKHQRIKFCRYLLWKKEQKEEKKFRNQEEREAKKGNRERIHQERDVNQHMVYGLGHNSLHVRITGRTINKCLDRKLFTAKVFGQKVVVDCSYEEFMTDKERSRVARGLNHVYSENRKHIKPFDLHFCGVRPKSVIMGNLYGQIPTLQQKGSPMEIHSQCFTELFPRERLVMLTPDSQDVLDYKFDDIYIVGGIVDFGRADPLTLAKAKRLGIRTARLPLDNLQLREGDTRELSMSGVLRIIREFQVTNDVDDILERSIILKSRRKYPNK